MNSFRTLEADEIECRISIVKQTGITLLLYKDARCDMNILDETVTPFGWMRTHSRDNANCVVSIWDKDKQMWISKEDTGTESFTEKEKGLASDSFKRACFNWGIGRELYTAPFIWVPANKCKIEEKEKGGKKVYTCYDNFSVSKIEYDEKNRIKHLVIINAGSNDVVYDMWRSKPEPFQNPEVVNKNHIVVLRKEFARTGSIEEKVCFNYKIKRLEDMTMLNFKNAMERLKAMPSIPEKTPVVMDIPDDIETPFN